MIHGTVAILLDKIAAEVHRLWMESLVDTGSIRFFKDSCGWFSARFSTFVFFFFKLWMYPLVNIKKNGWENHHAINGKIMENPLFLWSFSIANC
jgi:hypothetical protein